MKNLTTRLMVMFLLSCVTTAIFAANGNKGDWGFDPKYYNYALIEGEIISIDHDKKALKVKGTEGEVLICEHTEFFRGVISLPLERVFHPVNFNKNQEIGIADVKIGDVIKSRYSKDENSKIYLDTCLVVKRDKPQKSRGVNNETTSLISDQ